MDKVQISKLRLNRIIHGLSLTQLAYKSGIPASTLSLTERKFRQPTKDEIERLASTLEVAVEDLKE